jgi:hypothetical protein
MNYLLIINKHITHINVYIYKSNIVCNHKL